MVPVNEGAGEEAVFKDSRGDGVWNEHMGIAATSVTGWYGKVCVVSREGNQVTEGFVEHGRVGDQTSN